ncbi:MAG: hypothetical protein V1913_01650 [Fibrobacterota bacterium]
MRTPFSASGPPRVRKSSTCASRRLLLVLLLLGLTLPLHSAGGYGGIEGGAFISGNAITELAYSPGDSTLFALTGSGLSYARIDPASATVNWYNFSGETFQSGLVFSSMAAGDGWVFVTGYTEKSEGYSGGNIYFKSRTTPFQQYYPAFADGSTFMRLPYDAMILDSQVYVSLLSGTILHGPIPPSDTSWRCMLTKGTSVKELIRKNELEAVALKNVGDSLDSYRDLLGLTDTLLFARVETLFKTDSVAADSLLRSPAYPDSFTLKWKSQRFVFSVPDNDTILKDSELSFNRSMPSLAALIDSLRQVVLPNDTTDIRHYIAFQTLRYDTLTSAVRPRDYPPSDYSLNYSIRFFSLSGTGPVILAGSSGGLLLSSDHGKTMKDMLQFSSLKYAGGGVPIVTQTCLQKKPSGAFRSFICTETDTLAYSAWVPDTLLDNTGTRLLHEDSLKKWTVLDFGNNVQDLDFLKDTVFVACGLNSPAVLRKFYIADSIINGATPDTIQVWKNVSITLEGFLEPQRGINTVTIIPVDSAAYEIWAGTDKGLYRLRPGTTRWDGFEFKRGLEGGTETYAYPTVIQPGYVSANIAYSLSADARVTIDVYDFAMKKVRTLIKNQPRQKGFRSDVSYEDRWDGRDEAGRPVSPGPYYYKITAGSTVMFGKIVVFGAKDY